MFSEDYDGNELLNFPRIEDLDVNGVKMDTKENVLGFNRTHSRDCVPDAIYRDIDHFISKYRNLACILRIIYVHYEGGK